VGFYQRFIKSFSKVAHPLCKLLEKESVFECDEVCVKVILCLKEKLMYDASGVAFGVVLCQYKGNLFHPVYYASKTLHVAQKNYTVIEQELLVVVYAFKKFRAYLLGTNVVVHTHHAAICYLMA